LESKIFTAYLKIRYEIPLYDPMSGKDWYSVVWLSEDNLLKVKGHWVFKFISETENF
jgi:hypothetical protein